MFAGIHFIGTAVLLWLGYTWLGMGEARAGTLLESIGVAVLIVCLTCWLYGASFAFFADRRVWGAFRTALRRLALLVAAAIALILIYVLLSRLSDAMDERGFQLASWLTMKLRKPVKPQTVQRVFHAVLWVVSWIAVPLLTLPVVSAIVSRVRRRRGWLYWVEASVLLVMAVWAPLKLLGWTPHMKSFNGEMTSFVVRAAAAYLLFVAGWLLLAFVTTRGKARAVASSG
jgi:hypothetical protein